MGRFLAHKLTLGTLPPTGCKGEEVGGLGMERWVTGGQLASSPTTVPHAVWVKLERPRPGGVMRRVAKVRL